MRGCRGSGPTTLAVPTNSCKHVEREQEAVVRGARCAARSAQLRPNAPTMGPTPHALVRQPTWQRSPGSAR